MDKKKNERIYAILQETAIFHNVPGEQLEQAAEYCRLSRVKRGSSVFRKGEAANHLYILQKGLVMEQVYYRESVDVIVTIKSPGSFLGETAQMTDTNYLNTALALEDVVQVSMPKSVFLDLAWNHPAVCQVVIRELVKRLTNSAENMVHSMYLDAPGRLAFTVLNLTTAANRTMDLRVTQSALAATAGMARQTAAKILGDWRAEGWISTDRGRVSVLDMDRLVDIIMKSELHC